MTGSSCSHKDANGAIGCELVSALQRHADANRIALVAGGREVSYAELSRAVRARSAASCRVPVQRGQVVGLIMAKSFDAVATFLGVLIAGGVPCVLRAPANRGDLAQRVSDVGIALLIVDDELRGLAEGVGVPVYSVGEFTGDPGASRLPELTGSDRAMMLITSGTAGRPKGVLLSHRNCQVNARGVIAHTRLSSLDRLLHVMPLYHTNGINNQLLAPLLVGAAIVLEPRFDAKAAVQSMRDLKPTYVTGVPTMYSRMVEHVVPDERFPSLRFLRCGSAPITPRLHRQIEHAFSVPLLLSYGLSEATCTTTMNPVDAPRCDTVGTVLQGQQVRVVAPGTMTPTDVDCEGEICIGGGAVMIGYTGTDDADPIEDGWLRTGDLGRMDADGYLRVTGRLKEAIIRGGENISPRAVEDSLATHPSVAECCVVGTAHDDLGEVPVAFVRLGDNSDEVDEVVIQNWVMSRLGKIYRPERVWFVSALPTNSVGKIDRSSLRARLEGWPTDLPGAP